ncbi:cell division ATP-binding protein FtsE [Dethiobacter alkaliphilus]|uniref:Cell division ATP-binding protein FtsE n=1 Tax=Dethiobacter alkaliphilus AHT 1 TaxID=555088 RepID=C0GF91_DETAL|nr:cell division ATP-binding protein FtsE [Dethiobacter alkaliphilus]EEG77851.1 Sigma 54 interacting domain protein [Dethiobacter alkaliphilus AHT 1]
MIEVQRVSMAYPNGVSALKNINVCIERGEFVFVVGESGAGKSTLIRLMCREFLPTSGSIRVQGRDITRLKRREVPLFRRNVGVVFQDFRLLNNRSVYDNVAFAMQVIGAPGREVRRRVPEALEVVGISHKAKMKPQELSGGEQQRVCLARAIVNQPTLIIADEPTGNLDPKTSTGIMDALKNINIRGTTIVMATHDKDIVDTMRQRVLVLSNGNIVRDEKRGVYCQHAN